MSAATPRGLLCFPPDLLDVVLVDASREQVLLYRVHAQQLARQRLGAEDCAILDLGVQDTGPDGALWALALRGCRPDPDDLVWAWTLRGAPHVYRRGDVRAVAAATAPYSEADARKRVFDASTPLVRAGIDVVDALDTIASEMHDIVDAPTVKGDLSSALRARLPEPYQRFCRPCDAVHLYEQPFRLAALRGGLELEPRTSPPVLRRIPRWRGPASSYPDRLDVVRGVLHLLGPADPKTVAGYVDAPVKDIRAHWPEDVDEVQVDGASASVLAEDAAALASPPAADGLVRFLGPFDLFLQGRDRALVVPDADSRKDLWRTLGRPGAVLSGHEIVGTWRPRASGPRLRLALSRWGSAAPWPTDADLAEQAERLAAFRGVTFAGFVGL